MSDSTNDDIRFRVTVARADGDLYQRFAGKSRFGSDAVHLMRLGLLYEMHLLKGTGNGFRVEVASSEQIAKPVEPSKEVSTGEEHPIAQGHIDGATLAGLTGIGADYFSMPPTGVH